MDTYGILVQMPDTFSSTFSIAHNVAAWTKEELGEAVEIKEVVCSLVTDYQMNINWYQLALTFDWPPPPQDGINALGVACAKLGCLSYRVDDPLNYGLEVHQQKPFFVTNDILSSALQSIRRNTPDLKQLATCGRDCYTLHCNSLYT